MENLLIPALLLGSFFVANSRKKTTTSEVGAVKKPRLRSGDTIYIKSYTSKPDRSGNTYNAGEVYIYSRGSYKLIDSWIPDWGGKDMARQNAFDIIREKTAKPYKVDRISNYDLRQANIQVKHDNTELPIRKFNKQYK